MVISDTDILCFKFFRICKQLSFCNYYLQQILKIQRENSHPNDMYNTFENLHKIDYVTIPLPMSIICPSFPIIIAIPLH